MLLPTSFASNEGGTLRVGEQKVKLYRKTHWSSMRFNFSYRPYSKLLPSLLTSQVVPGLELIFITRAVEELLDTENGKEQTQHREPNRARKRWKDEKAPMLQQKERYGKYQNDIGAEDRTDEAATDACSESSSDPSENVASNDNNSEVARYQSEKFAQVLAFLQTGTVAGEHQLPSGNDIKSTAGDSMVQANIGPARRPSLSIPNGRGNNGHGSGPDNEADATNATAVDFSHAMSECSGSSSSEMRIRTPSFSTIGTSTDPCSSQDTSGASGSVDEQTSEMLHAFDGSFDKEHAGLPVIGSEDDNWVLVKRAEQKKSSRDSSERARAYRPRKPRPNKAEQIPQGPETNLREAKRLETKTGEAKRPETEISDTKRPKRKELGSQRPEQGQLWAEVVSKGITGESLRQSDSRTDDKPELDHVNRLGNSQSERPSVLVPRPIPVPATRELVSIKEAAPEIEMVTLNDSDDPQVVAASHPATLPKPDATTQDVQFKDAPWTFGSDLQCRKCTQVVTDSDPETSFLCNGCGPYSTTRYCSIQHLLDDAVDHWSSCNRVSLYSGGIITQYSGPKVPMYSGLDLPKDMCIPTVVPAAWESCRPAFDRPGSFDTVGRFRQLAHRMHDSASDYVVFNDLEDKVGGYRERLATLRWDSVPDRYKVLRLLDICFFDPNQTWATIALYRIIYRRLVDTRVMSIHVFSQLRYQFVKEFNFRRSLTWRRSEANVERTTLEREWDFVEQKVIQMEKNWPMLRSWSPEYKCFPGWWWGKMPVALEVPSDIRRRVLAWTGVDFGV